ncbi:Ig-like domain-containing protein [Diaminobutyricimonas sp. TR449]|uniref:Ig-like domain-containing protein n=1 Tax=Diaminobutyricimonas sp. TR449 TaxID=2708076 RepID=UPI001422602D|nr:Ig-like domain-containing protein [Diaminobutyricimonas sp. TR449]
MSTLRTWLAARRSGVVTATSGVLIAALVGTVAVVSSGYTAQKVTLTDGAVWVPNGEDQVIGRVSTEVLAVDTVVEAGSQDLDVVQSGDTVLMVDNAGSKLALVDPATAQAVESVPLPPEETEVYLAADRAVIHAQQTGEIWIVGTAELAAFDPESEPQLSLGANSVAAVDPNGVLFVFSPEARTVYRIDAARGDSVESTAATEFGEADGSYQITTVDGRWVVLDVEEQRLQTGDTVIGLDDIAGDQLALQAPSAGGSSVLIAHDQGLMRVPLGGADPQEVTDQGSGTATRPLVVDDCAYTAWSSGTLWRQCENADAETIGLQSMPPAARLDFAANGDRAVLNDRAGGASWAIQQGGQLIDNWDDLLNEEEDRQQVEENDEDTPPELERTQVAPVAIDDEFGARPGRSTVLPVLLNDYDANGDVLVIESTDELDPSLARLDFINQRQQLLLTLPEDASGAFTIGYTISDGRGGSASATITVTIRADGENSAPVQVRQTKATVQQGSSVTTNALGDWVDPDGDAFYLSSAAVAGPDAVSFEPDGTVVFSERGGAGDIRQIALVATDGTADGVGGLAVTVHPTGEVPIIAEPFAVVAYAGQPVTVTPLAHVRGGNGVVRLNGVPDKAGATIVPSYEDGTFTFVSDQVRTHYLEYVVADSEQSVTGLVRVVVQSPPDANSTPITVPKTVFVKTLSSETVDVAATDIDPAGGVLIVTEVMNVPISGGVRAEVLEQRSVRVTLTAPLQSGSATFNYRVSNGLVDAVGSITVVEIPRPDQLQPPVASDDTAGVRVGDAVRIPVLENDFHPDGAEIGLSPALVQDVASGGGLLFADGNDLRYLAPTTPGVYTAVYQITDPSGQTAQAQLTLTVREEDQATNNPPVPPTLTARVISGEQVQIDARMDGTDPDGDTVQLLGPESNPSKGSVVETGADYFVYEAGDYSAGTDTFAYTVIDGLGARATGTVRIGITPSAGAQNPVAVEDEVQARPGRSVLVQVLANDSDPEGSALTVSAVESGDAAVQAEIVEESLVRVTPPTVPGRYGLVYTIENAAGGSSSNFITVIVSETAPLSYPQASDTVLRLTDILDREEVDVDVLANVFFADGDARDLKLSVLPAWRESADVTSRGTVRVQIQDDSQIIPFSVAHPDDDSVRSYALIWVPGFDDALPQLDRTAGPLTVVSEETLRIDLADYVVAVGGRDVRLTDSGSVRATNSDGSDLVVDPFTLEFTSAPLYFGPASITFEVTDGSSATDPEGRTAILVLPITVSPRENQPPVFAGASVEFEPGQEREFDLVRLTNYPYADDADELAYQLLGAVPTGFEAAVDGQVLRVRAEEGTAKGTITELNIGVRDRAAAGTAGKIRMQVVASTRPLARPAADSQVTKRGETTVIDVLANDQAANPFPGEPLRVVAIRGIGGGALPAGVTVTPSADNSRLTVTVSGSAAPNDSNLQYQVADATGDRDRYVWGNVTISVQDVPDTPVAPTRASGGHEEGLLTLALSAPQFNNSPITRYEVVSSSHGNYRRDCGLSLRCGLPDLTAGLSYQFSVITYNGIGASQASPLSAPLSADYLPAAPTSVTAAPVAAPAAPATIRISWSPVPDPQPGSRVSRYVVQIAGSGVNWSTEVGRDTTDPLTTTANGQLVPGTSYTVTVYAKNAAQVGEADWRRTTATVIPVGQPGAPNPAPTAGTSADGSGAVTVSWGAAAENGAAGVTYSIARFDGSRSAPACSPTSKPGVIAAGVNSPWTDSTARDRNTYTYVVYADNGYHCTSATTGEVESKQVPGQASGSISVQSSGGGQFDIRVDSLSVASGTADKYQYRIGGSAWRDVTVGQWLTSLAGSGVYGNQQNVEFRGCRDRSDTFCGPPSIPLTATPVNTRAGIQSCVVGSNPIPTAPNNNGAAATVLYMFSYNISVLGTPPTWSGFTYTETTAVPPGAVAARVRATVTIGSNSYTDPGWGPIDGGQPCTTPTP